MTIEAGLDTWNGDTTLKLSADNEIDRRGRRYLGVVPSLSKMRDLERIYYVGYMSFIASSK